MAHDMIINMQKTEDCFHLGVKALMRNEQRKILLLQVNPASLRGKVTEPYWDIPGGRVQRGDTIEQTVRREVTEETGIDAVQNLQPLHIVLSNIRIPLPSGDVGLILAVYTCTIANDVKIILSNEHISWGWFAPSRAASLLTFKYPPEFTDIVASMERE